MTDVTTSGASRWRRHPLVRLFASIKFGVTLLFLILAYASVVSALPQVRGAVEMTEREIFKHWVFGTLIILFCLSVAAATCTRIRWNLVNAGVLTVHTGLLLLAGGSFWYFRTKVEGDVLLLSPRIELRTLDGKPIPTAKLPVEKGQTWTQFMPAFGGPVRVEVVDVRGGQSQPVSEARVRVRLGASSPKTVVLSVGGHGVATVGGRLQVALQTFPPSRTFFDDETAVLYYRQVTAPEREQRFAVLQGLPFYRERYLDEGYVLRDKAGRPVPSKRTSPTLTLAGLTIPTAWFEHWRLPIKLATPALPFDIQVTGYLPYLAGTQDAVRPGGGVENPAIELGLSAGAGSVRQWLLAFDPARSALDTGVPFEFRWVRSEHERDELLKPLAGPHELAIEVLDPPAKKTVAIAEGETIKIDGTPYELTIKRLTQSWPLLTPGFEGARSPVASVDVTNGDKSYNRTVIQRFPELSQDIDEQGTRHKDGPYDPGLILRYRTSATGWATITAGPGLGPVVGVFAPDGSVRGVPVAVGQSHSLKIRGTDVVLTLHALHRDARIVSEPVIEPLETRRPNIAPRSMSAIRLKFTGRREQAGWSEDRWIWFSQYPHVDAQPIRVKPPGEEDEWEFIYSRLDHELGTELIPGRLLVEFFPGRRGVESWRSEFFVAEKEGARPRPAAVYTNQTRRVGRWTLFQSGAAQDHWSYTILGAGNRNGIWPMVLGCVLITVGCLYAFYVKPVLKRRRLARARGAADADVQRESEVSTEPSEQPELVEV
ncbi:MAG: hypothetical protein ACE5I3_09515 [Phycisphaerae bacterium]